MLIMNCTKAATEFFTKTQQGRKKSAVARPTHETLAIPTTQTNAPAQWHWLVHAIKVKAKNVLIVMDYQTRFSITLTDLKKGDDGDFLDMFELHLIVHIHELMTRIDTEPQVIKASIANYRAQQDSRQFYLRGDRSVQSHLNDVAWHFRHHTSTIGAVPAGVDLISQDVFANQLLRKRKNEKNYYSPHHEFLHQWLHHYAQHSDAQATACIDTLKAKERLEFSKRHPELFATEYVTQNQDNSQDTTCYQSMSNVVSLDAFRNKNRKD